MNSELRSEWQTIDSAPTDVWVHCGGWEKSYDASKPLVWKEDPGVVWERTFWGKRKTYHGKEYSHWRPLPAPPSDRTATP